jgi:acetyl-CoA carboxylase biotin carboxylase subunit
MNIPIYYDPMIAKLIAWGSDREEARLRLIRAIEEYHVKGIRTTLPFGHWALQQPAFIDGQFDTGFIGKYFAPEVLRKTDDAATRAAAILAAQIWQESRIGQVPLPVTAANSSWKKRKTLR